MTKSRTQKEYSKIKEEFRKIILTFLSQSATIKVQIYRIANSVNKTERNE